MKKFVALPLFCSLLFLSYIAGRVELVDKLRLLFDDPLYNVPPFQMTVQKGEPITEIVARLQTKLREHDQRWTLIVSVNALDSVASRDTRIFSDELLIGQLLTQAFSEPYDLYDNRPNAYTIVILNRAQDYGRFQRTDKVW